MINAGALRVIAHQPAHLRCVGLTHTACGIAVFNSARICTHQTAQLLAILTGGNMALSIALLDQSIAFRHCRGTAGIFPHQTTKSATAITATDISAGMALINPGIAVFADQSAEHPAAVATLNLTRGITGNDRGIIIFPHQTAQPFAVIMAAYVAGGMAVLDTPPITAHQPADMADALGIARRITVENFATAQILPDQSADA